MKQPDEFSESFEDLVSPFVKSGPTRRCNCQSHGRDETSELEGTEEIESEFGYETEAEWEDERRKRRRRKKTAAPPGTDGPEGTEGSGTEGAGTDGSGGTVETSGEWYETEDEWEEFEEEATYDETEDESAGEFEGEAVPVDLRSRIVTVVAQELQKWGQGTRSETEPAMRPALRTYWKTVVKPSSVESQIDERKAWSAAFVSYVMRAAGAGNAFTGSYAHYRYIVQAKRARANRDGSKYQAFRLTEAKPEVGDIVCRDRGEEKCGGTNYDNVSDGDGHLTHCDIVTAVSNGSITIVGGNVGGKSCAPKKGCTVKARKVKLDSRGFVIAKQGSCAYFAILKAPQAAATSVSVPTVSVPPASVPTPSVVKASFALPSPRGYRTTGPKRKGKVRAVVVHTTGAGLASMAEEHKRGRGRGCTTALDCGLEWYARPGDGGYPHYLIAYDGTIYCTCTEDRVAGHAGWTKQIGGKAAFSPGRWSAPAWWARVWSPAKSPLDLIPPGAGDPNSQSIGIEVLGPARFEDGFTDEQYRALARLVVDLDRRHGIGITRAPSVKLLGHEDLNPLTVKGGRADAQGGRDPGAHRAKPVFSWPKLWALIEQGRTVHELEDEEENRDAETEFIGEAWESEAPESEWEWEDANA